MQLWAEYEGKTIAGGFPLTRLLRPEGQSAFFTTSFGDGPARVVRLTEAPANADEILSRWRGVAALQHPNILKLDDFGKVVINETSLLYAVMEPCDVNLGDVVKAQRLSIEETRQLAVSLLSVLEALHAGGFVHGHVEPGHVVAVHETVKLQCDSIDDAPDGEPGQKLKARDAHDLAALLLVALTQEQDLESAKAQLPLPAPFDSIVRKGLSGEWGLSAMSAALHGKPASLDRNSASLERSALPPTTDAASDTAADLPAPQMPLFVEEASTESAAMAGAPAEKHAGREHHGEALPRNAWWPLALLASVLLVVLLGTLPLLRSAKPGEKAHPAAPDAASLTAPAKTPSPQASLPPAAPRAAVPASPGPSVGTQWQVVAFSFRREAQARKKAVQIARRHPSLHPEVLRAGATGRYLVSLGGLLDRESAEKLAKELRHQGYPRDTHAQPSSAANS